ncbi:c-type cytochrome [Aliiglaciecola aliphaticivorans]
MTSVKSLIINGLILMFCCSGVSAAQTSVSGVILPDAKPGQYIHNPPTIESLIKNKKINPELKKVILKGYDIFMNTQQFRGKYVFNQLSCKSCHMGEGGLAWSAPVWPAATTLPDFRGKNGHVNSIEERIAGCFSYSLNGIPPAYDSADMLSLVAYHSWLATGAPMYENNIAGRGFSSLGKTKPVFLNDAVGEKLYQAKCAMCHGDNGQGIEQNERLVFPPLWGNGSYNWGAGMSRVFTAASFIKNNMPLGLPGSLSDEEAWQLAWFINGHERPQDPRFTGSVENTREGFYNFHQHTRYGTVINGVLLGDHQNSGEKPN